jgi:uncharacterized protein (DUF1778 family)
MNVSLREEDYTAIKTAAAARGLSLARFVVESCLPERRSARPITKRESMR